MKFTFSLARVLRLNTIWEEQAKSEFKSARAVYEKEKLLLDAKIDHLKLIWSKLTKPGTKTADHLGQQFQLATQAREDCNRQQEKLMLAVANLDKAKESFKERRRRRKTLANLEGKRYQEFSLVKRRSEDKLLDEVATTLYQSRR